MSVLKKKFHIFYLLISIFSNFSLASYNVITENLEGYVVIKDFTTRTFTECYMRCEIEEKCNKTFIEDEGDDFKRCYLLSGNITNNTNSVNETIERNCRKLTVEKPTSTKIPSPPPKTTTKTPTTTLQTTTEIPSWTNVALGKPSWQSSNYSGRPDLLAKYGNDGNLETMSATDFYRNGWWQVDLKKGVNIKSIKIHLNGYNLQHKRYNLMTLETRLTGNDAWKRCKQMIFPPSITVEVSCDSDTYARFVKLDNADTYLAIHELMVMA